MPLYKRTLNLIKNNPIKFIALASFITSILAFTIFCNALVVYLAKGRTFDEVTNVPNNKVGVVMGCSKYLANNCPNLYFSFRIRAASKLYHAGKVEYLIVSGDNANAGYNEPELMKEELILQGVPADRIVCDYAGFRTLDTVVRTQKVFLTNKFTIVSQRMHNQRAVFLAKRYGMDVVAYNAKTVSTNYELKAKIRETLARVKAILDVYLLNTQPRFLGTTIKIGK